MGGLNLTQASSIAKETAKATARHLVLKKLNLIGLKYKLIIAGIILALLLLMVIIAGLIATVGGGEDDNPIGLGVGQAMVSAEVAQYRGAIFDELSLFGLSEYTELLLALMMQESGGKGNDPMQASESFCGVIGCISDPQLSIEKGVQHFVNVLERANKDVKLTLQSYNFGGGFIDYVLGNGGAYTKELAISFSQMMYEKFAHTGIYKCHRPSAIQHNACYGDIEYVDAVLKYLPSAVMGGGESQIVTGDLHSPVNREMYITSKFGWRDLGAGPEHHNGIDLRCNESNSIHSVKEGSVVYAGAGPGGYGNLVTVQHGVNTFTSYAHLSRVDVQVGQSIDGGNQVGMCGNTGRSFGAHLHFEIKTEMWGGYMNAAPYLGL